MFSPGQIYSSLLWFFLTGALFPILIYAVARIFPNTASSDSYIHRSS